MNNPEKPNVREFAVGSVCEIIKAPSYPEYLGKEVTVLGNLEVFHNIDKDIDEWGYEIDLSINGYPCYASHESLRLKRLPPAEDQWCREIMRKVTDSAPLSSKGDILIVPEVADSLQGR